MGQDKLFATRDSSSGQAHTVLDQLHRDAGGSLFLSLAATKAVGRRAIGSRAMVAVGALPHSSQVVFQPLVRTLHERILQKAGQVSEEKGVRHQ